MSHSAQRDQVWYQRIWDALDFDDDEATGAAESQAIPRWDGLPEWVQNVFTELAQQTCPSVPLKKWGVVTPRKLGLYLGQLCANAYAVGAVLNVSPEVASIGKERLEVLEANRSKPGVESLLQVLPVIATLLTRWGTDWFPRFEEVLHRAFKEALEQECYEEAVSFFQGFAKGISKPGLRSGTAALSTTATVIYQKLYFHWREVEQLQSVPELRTFLIRNGLSEPVLGEPERLEKLCERMGLSFRKRGRPRKTRKIRHRR